MVAPAVKMKAEKSYEARRGGRRESSMKTKDDEKEKAKWKRKRKERKESEGVLYRRGFDDEPLFLHARPVSRLMNCIIGNPEYKLDFAITSSNG